MSPPLPHFVFFLSADWETYHRPDMVRAFARALAPHGARLLCVDRLMCPWTGPLRGARTSLGGPSRGVRKWARTLGRSATGAHLERLDTNLLLTRMVTALDDRFALRAGPPVAAANRRFIRAQLDRALRAAGMTDRPIALWLQHPLWAHYAGAMNESLVVYEYFDNYLADPGINPTRARMIETEEHRLLQRADLVIATSARLKALKQPHHPHVEHVPNGAETSFYRQVQDENLIPDPQFAPLAQPVIGYLGTINEHTDLRLLRATAAARPGWTFVMIGKVDHQAVAETDDFRQLAALPNVHLLGWVERDRLLRICATFNVCIIPYRNDSEFNRFVNPNKLHEYTAMGKPIVAYGCVDVDSHAEIIWRANTPQEFLAAIEEAWKSDGPGLIQQRLALADRNSWDCRVAEMLAHVEKAWHRQNMHSDAHSPAATGNGLHSRPPRS